MLINYAMLLLIFLGFLVEIIGMAAKAFVNRTVFGTYLKFVSPDDQASEKYRALAEAGEAPMWPLTVSRISYPLASS